MKRLGLVLFPHTRPTICAVRTIDFVLSRLYQAQRPGSSEAFSPVSRTSSHGVHRGFFAAASPALAGVFSAPEHGVVGKGGRPCQATHTFMSLGDPHSHEVSRDGAAPGVRADRQGSERTPPGRRAVGFWVAQPLRASSSSFCRYLRASMLRTWDRLCGARMPVAKAENPIAPAKIFR